jgi:hypothetical protein
MGFAFSKLVRYAAVTAFCLVAIACGPNETVLRSNTPTPVPSGPSPTQPPSNDPLEKEIEAMQTADFNFIYVLKRPDGGVFDADDKSQVRKVTANVNRRTLSDDEKAVIIGSNTQLPANLIDTIKARFVFEDHSKPGLEVTNSNAAANTNMTPSQPAHVR